jgi:hypothetical protein
MNSLLFDTCFLIDLERELRRGPGKAHQFLQQHAQSRPCLTWIVAGEFAEGFGDIHHPTCAAMLARFDIVPMDEETAPNTPSRRSTCAARTCSSARMICGSPLLRWRIHCRS